MEKYALILAAGLITYATRLAGLLLGRYTVPAPVERFLAYVPVAVFAALIAPDLGIGTSQVVARLAGVCAAGLVVFRYRQLWAGLGAGMAVYWIVRSLSL